MIYGPQIHLLIYALSTLHTMAVIFLHFEYFPNSSVVLVHFEAFIHWHFSLFAHVRLSFRYRSSGSIQT